MSDWDHRQLCPDGACVGVIGGGGTCNVCGRAAPNWGDERNRGLNESDADGQAGWSRPPKSITRATNDALYFDIDPEKNPGEAEERDSSDPDWKQRELCPDDACIGVLGDNSTCKVCG